MSKTTNYIFYSLLFLWCVLFVPHLYHQAEIKTMDQFVILQIENNEKNFNESSKMVAHDQMFLYLIYKQSRKEK